MLDKNGAKEPSDQETFNQSQEPKVQTSTGKRKIIPDPQHLDDKPNWDWIKKGFPISQNHQKLQLAATKGKDDDI